MPARDLAIAVAAVLTAILGPLVGWYGHRRTGAVIGPQAAVDGLDRLVNQLQEERDRVMARLTGVEADAAAARQQAQHAREEAAHATAQVAHCHAREQALRSELIRAGIPIPVLPPAPEVAP